MPSRVLVVGDVMTDVIVRPEGALVRGSDRRARIRSHPGGSGANQAAWLAHFGVPVRFAARVGAADIEGQARAFERAGVEPRLAGDPDRPTGAIVTLLDPDGERSFLTDRGANDALGAGDLPATLLDDVALLHISAYALFTAGPRAAVLALVSQARARGIAVSIDPASTAFLAEVGPAAFLAWTDGVDCCFPNEAEAALLAGSDEPARQREVLAPLYGALVIKRGAAGAEVISGGRLTQRPAPATGALDTTGAGDAFLAGFLARHLAGADLSACLEAGIAAGSSATAFFGGRPPASG